MRLTKDIKNKLITNLLKQAPLGLRAIACMEERRDIVKTARLLCLAAEKTTDLEIRGLREMIKRKGATMRSNLAAVNTSEKLREMWPEAFPFLPAQAKTQTAAVALSPETLNALCGLPK